MESRVATSHMELSVENFSQKNTSSTMNAAHHRPLPLPLVRKLQAPIDDSISLREWVQTLRHLERRRRPTTQEDHMSNHLANDHHHRRSVHASFLTTLCREQLLEMEREKENYAKGTPEGSRQQIYAKGGVVDWMRSVVDDAEYRERRRCMFKLKESMLPQDHSEAYRKYWQQVEQRPGPSMWPDGEDTDAHAIRELAASCALLYLPLCFDMNQPLH